jgi:hypothetical protein
MTTPCVAGTRILKMRDVILERYGQAPLTRGLAAVEASVREEYEAVTPITWVRTTTDYAVHDALAATLGREKRALHEELLREAMARSFKTIWRVLLRLTSDEAIISRTPSIYAKTRNVGEMHARLVVPGEAAVQLSKYPQMTARDARCTRAISNSFGYGGQNVCLVMTREPA